MVENIDTLELRCPKLGGTISFQYCLSSGTDSLPCHKVIDCWWEIFDVVSHIREILPEDKFEALMAVRAKPPEKISSLLDLIERAKSNQQNKDN